MNMFKKPMIIIIAKVQFNSALGYNYHDRVGPS